MDQAGFRAAVDGYRRPTGHTQQELARALALNPKMLSHKLHGSDGAVLRQDEVRSIVRVLADWGALTTRTQAIDLLGLMGLGPITFSASEWGAPPLSGLDYDPKAPSVRLVESRVGDTQLTRRVWLPSELTPLVGRAEEVRQVVSLFCGGARLVTLTGAGGTGKTRLALAVAAALGQGFCGSVHMVALAAVADAEHVPVSIAAELGVRESEGGMRIDAVLLEYLRDQRLLLVLDNLEQVLACALFIAEMLRVAPGLRVLATSRVPLRTYGEHEFRVPPLRLPAKGTSGRDALTSEAVSLFIQRARAVRADFRPGPAQAAQLTEICTRLDGLPLAIELAAVHVRHLSVDAVVERLGNRLQLLGRGPHGLPARQRTLRATLDWSYALLSPARQRLFGRLGAFVGGCTLDMVRCVCADDEEDVEAALWDLVESALLEESYTVDPEQPTTESRFAMLETVREYALVRLAESGDAHVIRGRHRDWCTEWAERASQKLTGPDQATWYRRIAANLDNLRAARVWCRADPSGAPFELRLAAALAPYFHIRAPGSEAREWLTDALTRETDAPDPARATVLCWLGQLEYLAGEAESGRARLIEAVNLARQIGNPRLLALTLRCLALYAGDPAIEPVLLEEAAAAAGVADDGHELVLALSYLGAIYEQQDDLSRAKHLYDRGVAVARGSGDLAGVADGLLRLGGLALASGDCTAARAAISEALLLSRAVGYAAYVALAERQLARVAVARGELTEARAHIHASLELARQAEPGTEALGPLRTAASVAVALDSPALAVRLLAAETAWRTRHPLGTDSSLWARWVLSGQGVEQDLGRARAGLGEQTFAAAWDAGSALPLKAALAEAYALAPPDTSVSPRDREVARR